MQLPVTLTLHPPRRLVILLFAVHAGALGLVAVLSLPFWIKSVLLLAILLSAWRTLQPIQGRKRIVHLRLREDGTLEYTRLNDEIGAVRVHPHTTVTPWLTVLLLRTERRVEPLVLLPDSLEPEEFRQLRLWMRWRAAPND